MSPTAAAVGSTVWRTLNEAAACSDRGVRHAAETLAALNLPDCELVVLCETRSSANSGPSPLLVVVARDLLAMRLAVDVGGGRIARFLESHQGQPVPRARPHPVTGIKARSAGVYELRIDGLGDALRFNSEAAHALYHALTGQPLTSESTPSRQPDRHHRAPSGTPRDPTAWPVTSPSAADESRLPVLRYATWLALVGGLMCVVAGFVWASTLGATPDWSSWSDRGAALLITGGALAMVIAVIVAIVCRRRIEDDRLLTLASSVVGLVALIAALTIMVATVELVAATLGGRGFSWRSAWDITFTR